MASPTASSRPAARATPVGARGFDPGRWTILLFQILLGASVVGVWEVVVRAGFANPLIFSSPSLIALRMWSMLTGEVIYGRTIYDHLMATLQQIAIGYVLGAAAGIALGYFFGRSQLLLRIFEPYILALFSIPKIALAPLFIIILGIGLWARVGIVFIEVFFVVFFNTLRGVLEVNEEHVQIARIMGASRRHVTRRVIIPSALPSIMVGLKVGVPFAMIGAILGEYIASNHGLGWLILFSSNSFDASGVWSAILFLVVLTTILSQIVTRVEGRILSWQPQRSGRGMTVA